MDLLMAVGSKKDNFHSINASIKTIANKLLSPIITLLTIS